VVLRGSATRNSRLAKQAAAAARRESGECRYDEQLGLAAFICNF
jgi:hypothetical protein